MKDSRYAWLVVAMLWLVLLLNYLDRQVIFSLFPLLRNQFHLNDDQLGLIPAALVWVYAICSPFAGFVGDRFGRKRVIVLSLLIWSLMSAVVGLVRSFPQLLAAVALLGISEACYLQAGLALIADFHGKRTRSLATGLHYSGCYIGVVAGGAGGGWIGEHYGWREVFLLLGTIGLAYSLFLVFVLRENAQKRIGSNSSDNFSFLRAIKRITRLPGFLTLALVFSAMGMANWVLYSWMPLYLYERFHMSLGRAGFSATFYIQVGSVVGIVLGGRLADHFISRTQRSRILTQSLGLIASAPFLLFVGMTRSSLLLLLALVVFGIGRGAYDANCMPVLCQLTPSHLRSTAFGLLNFAGCMAGGTVAAVAGVLKSTMGLGPTIQITGLMLLGSALLLLRVRVTAPEAAISDETSFTRN